ncbi:MAG: glycosyltransferase family 39 protein [Chloroflexota bacterium]
MTEPREPRVTGDLSVLDAWRLLARPVPTHRAAGYVGLCAVILLLNLSAIAAIVATTVADPTVASAAGLLLTTVIPGLLLAFAIVPTQDVDAVEWAVLAFGLGILTAIVGGVLAEMLPMRLTPLSVVGWSALVSLTFSAFAFGRGMSWRPPARVTRSELVGVALVLVFAAALRLSGLGYSEFQGDETEVILRATGVVQSLPDALYYHGKGPGEIVVVALGYGLVGALSEGTARLTFALAGVGGVVAFSLVARRLLGSAGGLAAGLLLAVNGYFLAFSRITQYQSLVLVLGMLGLWCAVRWSQGGSAIWPVLAGAFVATAALAHYDALWLLPPIGLVVLWRTGLRGLTERSVLLPWLQGALAGIVILALFFVPYLDSPLFALATDRIGDRVGAGFPRNNLQAIVASGELYLGTAYPLILAGLILLGGLALLARRPSASSLPVWLLGLVWAVVPLLFYAFVARKPGTHIHVATAGLALLAGAGFAVLWGTASPPLPRLGRGGWGVRALLATLLIASLALVIAYLVPVYLQSTAEVVRENRVASLPLAWRPPGGLPTKERFGFPYQAGWKAIGTLFADGTLQGSYDSNEQPQVTYWYTRGSWRCSADPRYYLIAENVQDEIETPRRTIDREYHPVGTVTVAGEPKLRVFERGPASGARPTTWRVEDLTLSFDRQVSAPTFDPGVWARGVVARESTPLTVRFGGDVDLLGYQLYAERPQPGGVVRADLFWLPRVTADRQHRIDVQLGRDPRIGDGGGPACDKTGDDQSWVAGRTFVQRVSIPIAASAPTGQIPLLVSVSRLGAGGGPLSPTGGSASGSAGGDSLVEIGQVEVRGARGAR